MIVLGTYIALLVIAGASDVIKLRIPNAVCLALVALILIPMAFEGASLEVLDRLVAFAAVFAIGWCLFAFGVMGGGDVKLYAATALWVGLDLLLLHVVYLALFGLVLASVVVTARSLVTLIADRTQAVRAEIVPASLKPGNGIPYGVAICASAMTLADRFPEAVWVF